jgi:uncharacterized protein (DUF58 family)
MITARGWWFLIADLSVLTLGAFGGRLTLTLMALTLLLWFMGEWLLFFVRRHWVTAALRVHRALGDERGAVTALWAGRSFRVRLEVRSSSRLGIPYVRIAEFVPFGARITAGETAGEGELGAAEPMVLRYTIQVPAPGRIRFEGLSVQMADFHGFFYSSSFIRREAVYRVLAPLADAQGHRPATKRSNLMPAPGIHRHLRPGSGSELLDLRDYLPGDPPKTIAWKVSARRDKLITKEFESEVPIRCTLFVDTSQSVRIGAAGQNALARIAEISAAVAQASAGIRDYTGLCLFDESEVLRYLRPARGARHLAELLNLLSDAAGLAPTSGIARPRVLLSTALAFAYAVYPHLLRPELNAIPGWFPWLADAPGGDRPRFYVPRSLIRWFALGVAFLPFAVTGLVVWLVWDELWRIREVIYEFVSPFAPLPSSVLLLVGIAALASVIMLYYLLVRLAYGVVGRLFAPRRRRRRQWRKRLAAVLAAHYDLGPGGIAQLLEDNERFALWTQRFLAEHHVPYALPLYDRRGHYLYASPGKVEVLASALLRAILRVRDNELFVLLVDLLELVDELDPLVRAVRVTLARHHRVLIICPWPPGMPPPGRPTAETVGDASDREPPLPPGAPGAPLGAQTRARFTGAAGSANLEELTALRLERAFHRLRRVFGEMRVSVVCAAGGDPVRVILARLNQLRTVGMGRQ